MPARRPQHPNRSERRVYSSSTVTTGLHEVAGRYEVPAIGDAHALLGHMAAAQACVRTARFSGSSNLDARLLRPRGHCANLLLVEPVVQTGMSLESSGVLDNLCREITGRHQAPAMGAQASTSARVGRRPAKRTTAQNPPRSPIVSSAEIETSNDLGIRSGRTTASIRSTASRPMANRHGKRARWPRCLRSSSSAASIS